MGHAGKMEIAESPASAGQRGLLPGLSILLIVFVCLFVLSVYFIFFNKCIKYV